jgi:hypothetical protein
MTNETASMMGVNLRMSNACLVQNPDYTLINPSLSTANL